MKLEINENSEKRFMHGKINLAIRLYYYLKEGVEQLSGFRTIVYALIGVAGVLAVSDGGSNWPVLIFLGFISIPIFILVGWMWVKRGKKSEEYFNLKYATTYGKYQVELQEEQMRLLKEILEELKKQK